MKYVLKTYQGIAITLTQDFDPETYLKNINQERIESVAIGAVSMMKHNIQTITPEYDAAETPAGEKVSVYLSRGGDPIIAHVEGYDAGLITKQVNDRVPFLKIGDVIINRNDYSLVMPAQ